MPKIVQACMQVIPEGGHLNVDSVRVAKVLGASFHDSMVVNGMVIPRNTEGTIKHMPDAKIICFNVEVEATNTENKGTVLIESSEQLMNYNKSEEKAMEDCIKAIADCGANVIITGSKFSEMALHFIERYKMMAIKIPSKFELRRVCRAATMMPPPQHTRIFIRLHSWYWKFRNQSQSESPKNLPSQKSPSKVGGWTQDILKTQRPTQH